MKHNTIFNNAQWIIGCKVLQSLIQLIVGMLTIRYLGPTSYGLVDYAASITAFAIPIMQLGLQSTLVQEYVKTPEQEGAIIGTHLVMNMMAAVVCIIGIFSFASVANPGDEVTIRVCALYSVSLVFQAVEMLQYWFQAKLLSKYSSLAMLGSYLIVSLYKIFLLVSGQSVYWFALSHAVEYGATGLLLLITYFKVGDQKIRFSLSLAKKMLHKSKHYIIAMLLVVVYGRIGNVLLTQLIGETENGYYATAVTCTCITNFVFLAIIDTARPVVLESKKRSQKQFEKNTTLVYGIIIWLSFAQCIFMTIFAKQIIMILFGSEYLPAVPVLQIMVWNTAFSYMGYVRNIWILGEEKHKSLTAINLIGVVTSVVANLLMIPMWGARGAAMASVVTQIITNFVSGFVLKSIRYNNRLLLKGVHPETVRELASLLKRYFCQKGV